MQTQNNLLEIIHPYRKPTRPVPKKKVTVTDQSMRHVFVDSAQWQIKKIQWKSHPELEYLMSRGLPRVPLKETRHERHVTINLPEKNNPFPKQLLINFTWRRELHLFCSVNELVISKKIEKVHTHTPVPLFYRCVLVRKRN